MRCPRLSSTRALQVLSPSISWKPLGKPQQTIASEIVRSGIGLHSGVPVTARLFPATAGEGRYFIEGERDGRWRIPATIDHAVESPLCTTLAGEGVRVRTVEHLLSALEACGVDNCGIEIRGGEEPDEFAVMYGKCGSHTWEASVRGFGEMLKTIDVSWNSL